MGNNRKIVVTSALPYANGDIHIGHLVEYVQTDFWVRFQKMRGNECVYVCADDTHGTPIMIRARKEGITPEELIARVSEAKRDGLIKLLSNDPRPSYQDEPERMYSMRFAEFDVRFKVKDSVLTVVAIDEA